MISRILLGASAAISLFLGGVDLECTAFTNKFNPTEEQLETAMKRTPMRISGQTTMWAAWIGFHFSRSMGLILSLVCICLEDDAECGGLIACLAQVLLMRRAERVLDREPCGSADQ
jgi:hypothetical protein